MSLRAPSIGVKLIKAASNVMTKKNLWHKGTNEISSKWPILVNIEPDEILSSWLIRIAVAHGCDPISLSNYLWGNWRCWTIDIDRGIPKKHLETLSFFTCIPSKNINLTSLSYAIKAFTGTNQLTHAYCPFVIPLGSSNRKRHSGFQFCPQCLKEDTNPYYRIHWRIAWNVCCLTHHCLLLDKCPCCNELVEPHLINVQTQNMNYCVHCNFDLSRAITSKTSPALELIQNEAIKTVNDGQNNWSTYTVSSTHWFKLLRYFISLLRKARKYPSSNLSKYIRNLGINSNLIDRPKTGLAFELLPINERIQFLEAAGLMMKLAADTFEKPCFEFQLTQRTFLINKQLPPFPINSLIQSIPQSKRKNRSHLLKAKKVKSPSTVQHIWERLKRQHFLR